MKRLGLGVSKVDRITTFDFVVKGPRVASFGDAIVNVNEHLATPKAWLESELFVKIQMAPIPDHLSFFERLLVVLDPELWHDSLRGRRSNIDPCSHRYRIFF